MTVALLAGEQRERAQVAEVLAADLLARQERLAALQTISASLATTQTSDETGTSLVRMSALFLNATCVIISTLGADVARLAPVAATS